MLHTRLNQLKHRNPLIGSIISFNGARIKVNLLLDNVTMLKLKGYKIRLTCKQIRGTYTYGRLLRWGQGIIFQEGVMVNINRYPDSLENLVLP